MDKKNFAFDRTNFILLAIGMAVVILGFILMSGSGSTEDHFNPSIFDARHVRVAPIVCLAGYVFMIYAIIRTPKDGASGSASGTGDTQETAPEA